MTRLVYWVGDVLVRMEAHPRASFAARVAFIWVAGTLGLHLIPRWYGDGTFTLGWGQAAGISLIVAPLGAALASFFAKP